MIWRKMLHNSFVKLSFVNNVLRKRRIYSDFEKLLSNLFFMLALYPYISFGMMSFSDSQPWPAIVSLFLVIIAVLKKKNFSKIIFFLYLTLGACMLNITMFFLFTNTESLMFLRAFYKYISFITIVPSVMIYWPTFSSRILKYTVFLWLVVSNIQYLAKKPLVDFLLPRASYVVGRSWVIGFAPEPAYMARTVLFFLLVIDLMSYDKKLPKKEANLLRIGCLWMLILSSSLTGFLLLFFYLFLQIFKFLKLARATVFALLLVIISIVLIPALQISSTSMGYFPRIESFLIKSSQEGFLIALISDPSFITRTWDMLRSLKVFFEEKKLLGAGIPENPIGSLFSPIYENGIYGLILIFLILTLFWNSYRVLRSTAKRIIVSELMIFFIILTFSDSLSTSYIAFIIGMVGYLSLSKGVHAEEKITLKNQLKKIKS
jgi:hypothetical protein